MLAQSESGTNVVDFESAGTADSAFCRLRNNLDFRTVIAHSTHHFSDAPRPHCSGCDQLK